MTKLSKNFDPKDMGFYVNNVWAALTLMDSKEQIRQLVKDLFTHTEYKMFAKRLEIARRLLKGETYDEIKQALKVTEKPITSVSNILANGGLGFRDAHKKLTQLEQKFKNRKKLKIPRYKSAPRITEIVSAVVDGASTHAKKLSAKKHLDV